jgi:hypothetical protein
MTGWRLGYIGAPKEIADACDKVQGQFTSATCSITQKAAIAAMKADPAVLSDMIAAFKSRRELVLNAMARGGAQQEFAGALTRAIGSETTTKEYIDKKKENKSQHRNLKHCKHSWSDSVTNISKVILITHVAAKPMRTTS